MAAVLVLTQSTCLTLIYYVHLLVKRLIDLLYLDVVKLC